METPPTSSREQGMQALKEGNLDKAIELLARSVMQDDSDLDAKALLGVAYSQKGLHAQAKRALQTAVERAPQNPNFRFNLGVVLQRGGDLQGAAVAFRDTLQINPQHAQARAKLQEMGPQVHQLLQSAPKPTEPVGVPSYTAGQPPAAPPHQYGAPPGYGPPPGQPPGGPPPFNPLAPPAAYPGGQAPAGGGLEPPPGQVQCPSCHQFSRPGLACQHCSSALPPPARPQAQPMPYPGGMGGPAAPAGYGPAAHGPAAYGGAPAYARQDAHRGAVVLTLGLLSFFQFCPIILGIIALNMAGHDLSEMDAGRMDPAGRGITNAGKIFAIIGLVITVIWALIVVAVMVMGGGR